jgi:hypothetical protein
MSASSGCANEALNSRFIDNMFSFSGFKKMGCSALLKKIKTTICLGIIDFVL